MDFQPLRRWPVIGIIQRSPCSAIHILILTVFQRPHKSKQAQCTQQQRYGNEEYQHIHANLISEVLLSPSERLFTSLSAFSRSALRTTMIEEVDIAMAAIIGVA